MKSKVKIFTTENDDKIIVWKTDSGKISIMINDGDGKGVFTVKETKELIEIIRKAIINN